SDGLTPARDLEHVYRRIASTDKKFCVIGKAHGCAHDYSHADLILGLHAPDDVYPVVVDWLDAHRATHTTGKRQRSPPLRVRGDSANPPPSSEAPGCPPQAR